MRNLFLAVLIATTVHAQGFMPGGQSSGSFQTPDILNNDSFESGFGTGGGQGAWQNFSGVTPPDCNVTCPDGNGYTVDISTAQAFIGTHSMHIHVATNTVDDGSIHDTYNYCSDAQTTVWVRVYFYVTNIPTNHTKWVRFWDNGFNTTRGGLFLSTVWSPGGMSWDQALSNDGDNDIGVGIPTFNTWHEIEVEYDRSTWASAGKGARARFWYDGNQVVGTNSGSPNYSGSAGGTAFWGDASGNPANGPWLYDGTADTAVHQVCNLTFLDTVNGPNTQANDQYFDKVAISSLGRIGP